MCDLRKLGLKAKNSYWLLLLLIIIKTVTIKHVSVFVFRMNKADIYKVLSMYTHFLKMYT